MLEYILFMFEEILNHVEQKRWNFLQGFYFIFPLTSSSHPADLRDPFLLRLNVVLRDADRAGDEELAAVVEVLRDVDGKRYLPAHERKGRVDPHVRMDNIMCV